MTERADFRAAGAALAASAASFAASEAADATTISETTDFGNTFATRTLLPGGTDVVNNASVFPFEGDSADFVTFQSLTPGASFTLSTTNTGNSGDNVFTIGWYVGESSILDGDAGPAASIAGTVPQDGNLHFGLAVEGGPSAGVFYTLTLNVPEPSALALLGGGLLAAAVLVRARARRGA